MTTGHKHRTIKTTPGSRLERVLRWQFYVTDNRGRVDKSRLVFGPARSKGENPYDIDAKWWGLSPLGVLHGLIGLTLEVDEP